MAALSGMVRTGVVPKLTGIPIVAMSHEPSADRDELHCDWLNSTTHITTVLHDACIRAEVYAPALVDPMFGATPR